MCAPRRSTGQLLIVAENSPNGRLVWDAEGRACVRWLRREVDLGAFNAFVVGGLPEVSLVASRMQVGLDSLHTVHRFVHRVNPVLVLG